MLLTLLTKELNKFFTIMKWMRVTTIIPAYGIARNNISIGIGPGDVQYTVKLKLTIEYISNADVLLADVV